MKRWTRQRDVFKKIFNKAGRPLFIQEALGLARESEEKIGQATAYRVIKEFVEQGFLKAIEMPGEPTLYELADLPHHHFFHCHSCEKVFGLEVCPKNLCQSIPNGFEVSSHELFFYGRCLDCGKDPHED